MNEFEYTLRNVSGYRDEVSITHSEHSDIIPMRTSVSGGQKTTIVLLSLTEAEELAVALLYALKMAKDVST